MQQLVQGLRARARQVLAILDARLQDRPDALQAVTQPAAELLAEAASLHHLKQCTSFVLPRSIFLRQLHPVYVVLHAADQSTLDMHLWALASGRLMRWAK